MILSSPLLSSPLLSSPLLCSPLLSSPLLSSPLLSSPLLSSRRRPRTVQYEISERHSRNATGMEFGTILRR
jgi:hypothetical protein